ncbi:MAG: peptidoglycan DD-metalloendopeptidase family protein [Casimicrobiaceae bacterium]
MRRLPRTLSPGQALAVAILCLSGVAAFGITPGTTLDTTPTRDVSRTLELPQIIAAATADDRYWHEERVRRGDTIGSLLARADVDDPEAMQFLRTDPAAGPLYLLRPGRALRVATDEDGKLVGLRFLASSGELFSVTRDAAGFHVNGDGEPSDVRVTLRTGEIQSSLFGAADAAGLPDAITLALVDVFAGDIDFYHDIRRGDRFSVIYEMRYVDGEPVASGRILAAEFDNRGVAHRAFLWRAPDGSESYYTDDGRSLRRAFLRSPVTFSRITSGFTHSRLDPYLHVWRAHTGTDFAAPIGTPVHATADGVVKFVGTQVGYGNVIMLRHDATYTSVYGHLSRFEPGLHDGERVHQGDTIGFVGMTGWATGPHLHYEMRVAGVPRDPMKVALPAAAPITPDEKSEFLADVAPLVGELAVVDQFPVTQMVSAE